MAERFVKTVKKSLLCSHLETGHFDRKVQEFLINYRSTPHATTGKSPYETVFGRKMNNFLPTIQHKMNTDEDLKATDDKNKAKAKDYADNKRKTKHHQLQVGDMVLRKQRKINNLTPYYDPKPYKIIKILGTTIKAQRESQIITRNASFFKKFITPPVCDNPKTRIGQDKAQIQVQRRQEKTAYRWKFVNDVNMVPYVLPPTPGQSENTEPSSPEQNERFTEESSDSEVDDPLRSIFQLFNNSLNDIEIVVESSESETVLSEPPSSSDSDEFVDSISDATSPDGSKHGSRPQRNHRRPNRFDDFIYK